MALSQERTLFLEKDDVMASINTMCSTQKTLQSDELEVEDQIEKSSQASQAALAFFCSALEKYQEASFILDGHLEEMVTPLFERIQAIMHDRESELQDEAGHSFPFQVYRNPQLHLLFKAVNTLCRVRGYKRVVKFLPHEAADLEPTVRLLQSQDRADHATWETRYVLLLWLSMLALIPFDLETVDSSLAEENAQESGCVATGVSVVACQPRTLVESIVNLCESYLSDSGRTREGAAVCLSRLLTRPDMDSVHLSAFLTWANATLEQAKEGTKSADVFTVTGVLTALVEVFKHGHREQLLQHLPRVLRVAVQVASRQGHTSSLERKLLTKLVQRVGLNFLPPRVVTWRYQRGQRSLLQNIAASKAATSNDPAVPVGAAERDATKIDDDEEDLEVPDQVEEVIEQLLCGLRDKDTVVRWSAAKGIGRVTSRLTKDMADDVVAFVLDLFDASEGDSAWHGGCLALAELARRGLLLPARLPNVVPLVVKALVYDVRRGHNSVRDAACYVCWAFARAYAPVVMAPHVKALSQQLLVTALFDREVNCRRAASAAFQENVGRQGHDHFAHGIEILTAADYFSLGNRSNAYLSIAKFVAKFEVYREPLIEHLLETKLQHWDRPLRELAARALAELAALAPRYVAEQALPRLLPRTLNANTLVRHGALLAAAELTLALAKVPFELPESLLTELRNTVMRIEKARLYRGRGGSAIREAACRLIECIALAGHPLSERAQLRLLDSIDESLQSFNEEVQTAAVAALAALTSEYFEADGGIGGADARGGGMLRIPTEPVTEAILKRTVTKYATGLDTSDNPAWRRGYALALGVLPARFVGATSASLEAAIGALERATVMGLTPETKDAETRRNAVRSLAGIAEKMRFELPGAPEGAREGAPEASPQSGSTCAALSAKQFKRLFAAAMQCMGDYETDDRGDVGSWVRREAMHSLRRLITAVRVAPNAALVHRMLGRRNDAEDVHGIVRVDMKGVEEDRDAPTTARCARGKIVRWVAMRSVAWVELLEADERSGQRVKVRAEGIHPEKQRPECEAGADARSAAEAGEELSTDVFILEPLEERAKYLVHDAEGKATRSVMNSAPVADGELGNFMPSAFGSLLPHDMGTLVAGVVLKQLCEKMDSMRHAAGLFLEWLLRMGADLGNERHGDGTREGLPLIVHDIGVLRATFAQPDGGYALNWKAPNETYPRVVGHLLGCPLYMRAVLSGLVLSVGALTESVSKEATKALLKWCQEAKSGARWAMLSSLARELLMLMRGHTGVDRVIVPLFKTLNALLEAGVFSNWAEYDPTPVTWGLKIHDAVKAEILQCKNVAKLLASVKVLCALAVFRRPVRTAAFGSLLLLLRHRYPKVRKAVADELYVWVLASDADTVCTAPDPMVDAEEELDPNEEVTFLEMVRSRNEQASKAAMRALRHPIVPPRADDFDPDAAYESVLEVLSEHEWDVMSTAEARKASNILFELLHAEELPRKKPKKSDGDVGSGAIANPAAPPSAAQVAKTTDEDSYASLVRETTY